MILLVETHAPRFSAKTPLSYVGYNSKQTGEHAYAYFGATFVPVNGAKKYWLSEVKAENCSPGDYFQLVNGSNLIDLDGTYVYVTEEFADGDESVVGWYDLDKGDPFEPEAKVEGDDVLIDVGRGFLVELSSGLDVKLTFAGEAPSKETEIKTDGVQYAVIANYIPRAIPLNWVVPSGAITPGDWIQKINPDNLIDNDATYAYVSEIFADGDDSAIGWYDLDKGDVFEPEAKIGNDVLFLPNDAYLCDMSTSSGEDTKFQFPSSLKVLED